jgi:hypothetical protein
MASSSRAMKDIFNPNRPDVHKRDSEVKMTCIDRQATAHPPTWAVAFADWHGDGASLSETCG